MPHKELLTLIIDEKTIAARDLFFRVVQKEGLWQKAFKHKFLLDKYKDCMLAWAFVHLCEKVKNGKIKDIEQLPSISGVIINTLYETFRVYKEDILIDIVKTEKEIYEDPVIGVNPFEEIEEKIVLEKLHEIIDDCLSEMGEICQSIITYKYIDNLEHKEIIRRIDKIGSEGASRVRLFQCMEKLKELCFKKLGK